MFIVEGDKKSLLSILNPEERSVVPATRKVDSLKGFESAYTLVWSEEPKTAETMPNAIIAEGKRIPDLLAWTATYVPRVRPFTAIVRVLDRDSSRLAAHMNESVALTGGIAGASVGIILGEAFSYSEGRVAPGSLSPNACASTLSFVIARALARGASGADIKVLKENWLQARTITKQSTLAMSAEVLEAPWLVMFALSTRELAVPKFYQERLPKDVLTACFQCVETGHISTETWKVLTRGQRHLTDAIEAMSKQREERVRAFQEAAGLASGRKARDATSLEPLLLGYLASCISPGTLDHLELLRGTCPRQPESLLWYGMFAGLKDSATVQDFAVGLGRRILRDLTRREDLLERPRGDISIEELRVLSESTKEDMGVRVNYPGYLDVEVAPCINSLVRMRRSVSSEDSGSGQAELLAEELFSAVELLGYKIGDVHRTFDRLAKVVGLGKGASSRSWRR